MLDIILFFLLAFTLNYTPLYPYYAEKIIRFAASCLPTKQKIREQEWLAMLDDIPINCCKLVYSLSFLVVIFTIRRKTTYNSSK